MINPVSTYRIQFNQNFTFQHFKKVIPYLQQLGIQTIYASPIFKAVPGSGHGYDVVDANSINPEIGTPEELVEIKKELNKYGMLWLQDIVPNHMAFHHLNFWLMDILKKGRQSQYADFLDIEWDKDEKLMVPFLGAALEEAIEKKELQLTWENGEYFIQYYDSIYPTNTETKQLLSASPQEKKINEDQQLLKKICDAQHYRLCHWQETDQNINYRRFFTINGLICLNIHKPEVLKQHHALVFKMLCNKIFDGLRIDHIDGLHDPEKYLHELRKIAGEETYIVVEKILQCNEQLPASWPVQGSTGYDFLAQVNNLFTNKAAEEKFTAYYQKLTHHKDLQDEIHEKKSLILHQHMGGELRNLSDLFFQLRLSNTTEVEQEDMKTAIADLLIHIPVYRFYGNKFPLAYEEGKALREIFSNIKKKKSTAAVQLLEKILLEVPATADADYNKRVAIFYQRCMQFSGPLMAKGVEDTLMYSYNRFTGHNEVGDAPGAFGISAEEFHTFMKLRPQRCNLSINATATHDTKRGEDVRARLNVLTDIADEWLQTVQRWMKMNKSLKKNNAPDANDEYLLYQSLIGHYPVDQKEKKTFTQRLLQFLEKAVREAKTHSNWNNPDVAYEAAIKQFAEALLSSKTFLNSFQSFFNKIIDPAFVNSLNQMILKFTCPGIPDVYQGTETWDYSFVDPDNRKPVDYVQRKDFLTEMEAGKNRLRSLWKNRQTAQIKLWLLQLLARLRSQEAELWTTGAYIPLKVSGRYKHHVFAFARVYRTTCYVIAIPLHTAQLHEDVLQIDWHDTSIHLPSQMEERMENILCGEILNANTISARQLFSDLPFAVIRGKIFKERAAGILLHITSLPSPFGVGDIGPAAKSFVDFLYSSGQQYWQLLPINPTEAGQSYSPYSATSSRAGFPLLISPELLAEQGYLTEADLKYLPTTNQVNYAESEKAKEKILHSAFQYFLKQKQSKAFDDFCKKEKSWLHDFALYTYLKKEFQKPWYNWPDEYKMRKPAALKKFSEEDGVKEIKWHQFIFFQQWKQLKEYCSSKHIKLIGDLPIYVSYDSADVWSHKEIFAIDGTGNRTGIAGVPPDAFSDEGQLWGMPVFRWDILKQQDYWWWKERIRKNLELFDVLRIDHFRAFAAYWEVPPGENTARNGEWKKGPGDDFFNSIKKEFGILPFIAEDLGDVDEDVFRMRDKFLLPGMKVLQFAFGDDLPENLHAPHNHSKNFAVYTGTHDNNTTKGWWRHEANEETKKRLQHYSSAHITDDNITEIMMKMAYASVAKLAIAPMQDVLNLGEHARMNTPASSFGNWSWRLLPHQITPQVIQNFKQWMWLYNR